jgi:hypothetical protein
VGIAVIVILIAVNAFGAAAFLMGADGEGVSVGAEGNGVSSVTVQSAAATKMVGRIGVGSLDVGHLAQLRHARRGRGRLVLSVQLNHARENRQAQTKYSRISGFHFPLPYAPDVDPNKRESRPSPAAADAARSAAHTPRPSRTFLILRRYARRPFRLTFASPPPPDRDLPPFSRPALYISCGRQTSKPADAAGRQQRRARDRETRKPKQRRYF